MKTFLNFRVPPLEDNSVDNRIFSLYHFSFSRLNRDGCEIHILTNSLTRNTELDFIFLLMCYYFIMGEIISPKNKI